MTLPSGTGWAAQFGEAGSVHAWLEPLGLAAELSAHEKLPLTLDIREIVPGRTWLVMLGVLEPVQSEGPAVVRCFVGFSNDPGCCDAMRERGFRILEAPVAFGSGMLEIALEGLAGEGTRAGAQALEISPLETRPMEEAAGDALAQADVIYRQHMMTPDIGSPGSELQVAEYPQRQHVRRAAAAPIVLRLRAQGRPVLEKDAARAWRTSWAQADAPALAAPPRRVPRRSLIAIPPAYRFEGVEAVGLRLNLLEMGVAPEAVRKLVDDWTAKLNFHVGNASMPADFRFEAASATLVIELLRYPRMVLEDSEATRYESQHELLLRLLVGRVDDGGAQARDAAFFVPAIFVDNVWSKFLGRELQGFDKRLAAFCVGEAGTTEVLLPNGCVRGEGQTRPLDSINAVRLVQTVGVAPGAGEDLLRIEGLHDPQRRDAFIDVDAALALSGFDIVGLGWRQADFDEKEFRRSFARQWMAERLHGFRSIQVAPVDTRPLGPAWIDGRFDFEHVRVALPEARLSLRLFAPAAAPRAWQSLCGCLSAVQPVTLASGDWYRLRCDMRLRIEDSLAW